MTRFDESIFGQQVGGMMQSEETTQKRSPHDLLARHVPAILWIARANGSLEFVTDNWQVRTGLTAEETSKRWQEVIHPEDVEHLRSRWQKANNEKTQLEAEVRIKFITIDAYRWHAVQAAPVFDASGAVMQWVGSLADISEQKKSEMLLQDVVNSIPGLIWWKDRESRYLGCNENMAKLAGFRNPAHLTGKLDNELPWREQADFYHGCDLEVMDSDKPLLNVIEPIMSANGAVLWIDTNKVPLHDANGMVVGTVGSSIDVTERLKLIHQREDFMSSLAHDLKVPVVGAVRALEVFMMGALGELQPAQVDFVKKMHASHEHLLTLIQNLLHVLRNEAIPEVLELSEVDVPELLRSVVGIMQPLAVEKNIELKETIPKAMRARIDAMSVKRLLQNLISNAIKFTPDGGKVALSVRDSESTFCIMVSDTGDGIAKEDQLKLFQRFWQGGAVKRYAAETGLGLFLCRQIAEAHGGRIEVISELGQGSHFMVTLPKRIAADSEVRV